LEQKGILGKVKVIAWSDIKSITFSKIGLELKVLSGRNKIKAHSSLVGFPELIKELEKQTNITQSEMGLPDVVKIINKDIF
jgi:hypothetical protein